MCFKLLFYSLSFEFKSFKIESIFAPYSIESSFSNIICGVILKFIVLAICVRINPAES